MDEEARWSPYDFVIAWGEMADPDVYGRLRIRQSNRWWHYTYGADFSNPDRIGRQAANMHLIPSDSEILALMDDVKKGDVIRLRGHLVELRDEKGWRWRSSMSRTDKGGGACELIHVQGLEVLSSQ